MKKPETAKTGKDPILKNTYNEFSIKTALVLAYVAFHERRLVFHALHAEVACRPPASIQKI